MHYGISFVVCHLDLVEGDDRHVAVARATKLEEAINTAGEYRVVRTEITDVDDEFAAEYNELREATKKGAVSV